MSHRSFLQSVLGLMGLAVLPAAQPKAQPKAQIAPMARVGLAPYGYMHIGGCEGIAFRLWIKPKPGTPRVSSDAQWPDGAPIRIGSPFVCGSCGRNLSGLASSAHVRFIG